MHILNNQIEYYYKEIDKRFWSVIIRMLPSVHISLHRNAEKKTIDLLTIVVYPSSSNTYLVYDSTSLKKTKRKEIYNFNTVYGWIYKRIGHRLANTFHYSVSDGNCSILFEILLKALLTCGDSNILVIVLD